MGMVFEVRDRNDDIRKFIERYVVKHRCLDMADAEWVPLCNRFVADCFRSIYTVVGDVNGEAEWAVINYDEVNVIYSRLGVLPIFCNNLYTFCLMWGVYIPYYDWLPRDDDSLLYGGYRYYRNGSIYCRESYIE